MSTAVFQRNVCKNAGGAFYSASISSKS
ncbi:hypothetical protein [Legionella jamestowniensis]